MIEAAILGQIELLIPEHALTELSRVLEQKLGFDRRRVEDAVTFLRRLASACPAAPPQVDALSGDPDDDIILASARRADAKVLVTGGRRHLLPLGEVEGVRVITPQALLAELATA